MDQTEDFEMKPLTPGLGFHKRQLSLKEHLAKTGVAEQSLRSSLPTVPPAEMFDSTQPRTSKEIIDELHDALKPIRATGAVQRDISQQRRPEASEMRLPFQPTKPEVGPEKNQKGIQNIDFQITDKALSEGVRRGAHDHLIKPLIPVPVSFASMLLDGIIILAFSLIFLVSLITVTGVDLVSVVQSTQSEFTTQISMLVLYFAVLEMYVVVLRSFFGCTVGEWTFDLQMGEDDQIVRASYPMLVLWRSFLILLSGVIFLPILSYLFNTDLASKFTGLQLYKKNI